MSHQPHLDYGTMSHPELVNTRASLTRGVARREDEVAYMKQTRMSGLHEKQTVLDWHKAELSALDKEMARRGMKTNPKKRPKRPPMRRNGELIQFPSRVPAAPSSSARDAAAIVADYVYKHATSGFTATKMAQDLGMSVAAAERILDVLESRGLTSSVKTVIKGTTIHGAPHGGRLAIDEKGLHFTSERDPGYQQRVAQERERSKQVHADAVKRSASSRFKLNDVVVIRGGRRRYVVAQVEPHYGGAQTYYITALSGGEAGSAPSGVREGDLSLAKDQRVVWEGAIPGKLYQRYAYAMAMLGKTPGAKLPMTYQDKVRKNPGIVWGKGTKRVIGTCGPGTYLITYHKIGTPPRTAEFWEVHYNGRMLGNQGSLKWAKKLAEQHQEKQG